MEKILFLCMNRSVNRNWNRPSFVVYFIEINSENWSGAEQAPVEVQALSLLYYEVDVLWENWIISNGTVDEFIEVLEHLKDKYTKKGYKEIFLMNPEDVPRECFADGRPEADPPMHTS